MIPGTGGLEDGSEQPHLEAQCATRLGQTALIVRGFVEHVIECYAELTAGERSARPQLEAAVKRLNATYSGIAVVKHKRGYLVNIPESFKIGHEAHFGQVMERYLSYLKEGNLPSWEVPNMLTKYATIMQAYEKSRSDSHSK